MEKFQIAKYGMMQVVAIVYAMLTAGASIKITRTMFPAYDDLPKSHAQHVVLFIRDYGLLFVFGVLLWTVAVAYLSSPFSKWDINPAYLGYSGLALAILCAILATFFAFAACVPVIPTIHS